MIVMKLFEVLHDQTRLIDQMGLYFINIVDEPMDIYKIYIVDEPMDIGHK